MNQSKIACKTPVLEAPKVVEGNVSGVFKQRFGLKEARRSAIEDRAKQMPKSAQATYLKATRGKASPRIAIKAFCTGCMGWERAEVPKCTALACPLWAYRPWKNEQTDRNLSPDNLGEHDD